MIGRSRRVGRTEQYFIEKLPVWQHVMSHRRNTNDPNAKHFSQENNWRIWLSIKHKIVVNLVASMTSRCRVCEVKLHGDLGD